MAMRLLHLYIGYNRKVSYMSVTINSQTGKSSGIAEGIRRNYAHMRSIDFSVIEEKSQKKRTHN